MSTATHTPSTNGQAQPGWMAEVEQKVLADLEKPRGRKLSKNRVVRSLSLIDPNLYLSDVWLSVGRAIFLGSYGFDLWLSWMRQHKDYPEGECEKAWREFTPANCEGFEAAAVLGPLVQEQWLTDDRGNPRAASLRNAENALNSFDIELRWNLFTEQPEINGQPPTDRTWKHLRRQIETKFDYSPTLDAVEGAVVNLAGDAEYHPVRDWISGLEWDGKPRLCHLPQHFGVQSDDKAFMDYQDAGLRLIFRGIISRVFHPGSKFDYMIILQSEEKGTGKTEAWEIITSGKVAEIEFDRFDSSKKLIEQATGHLVMLNEELEGFGKREVASIKSMITRRRDTARGAYRRDSETRERQFILGGTSNPKDFLREGKARRFVVIECGVIDHDWLRQNMAQLYAETVACHGLNEKHVTLDPALWQYQQANNEQYRTVDPAEDWLSANLPAEGEYYIEAEQLWAKLRHNDVRHSAQGVSASLGRMGWSQARMRKDGKRVRIWVLGMGNSPQPWNWGSVL